MLIYDYNLITLKNVIYVLLKNMMRTNTGHNMMEQNQIAWRVEALSFRQQTRFNKQFLNMLMTRFSQFNTAVFFIDDEITKQLRKYYAEVEGIVDVIDINSDHAVRLFQQTENYAKIGWQSIDFVDEAIDYSIIDKAQLMALVKPDLSYRNELTSDAVYYISASARVRMLYQKLQDLRL